MILRPARIGEIDYIRGIEMDPDYQAYISLDSQEDHLRQIQSQDTTLGIYEEGGRALGFLLGVYDSDLAIYELRRLALESRGQGLGKQALALAFQDAFESFGAQRLWLDVYEYNQRGIGLYRSMGMVHEGILRRSDKKQGAYVNQWIFSLLREDYLARLDGYQKLCNNVGN